jgi:hypothetical protein
MWVCEPVSRILCSALRQSDDHSSWPNITIWLQRPTRRCDAPSRHVFREAGTPFLFGLAPCGVYPALIIADQAVRSYRTFSPLPDIRPRDSESLALLNRCRAVCFLWHWPSCSLEAASPDVIRHTALWSSDFPLPPTKGAGATARSANRHQLDYIRRGVDSGEPSC